MQNIFLQYKNQQIDYRQFLTNSREILGDQLYNQLYQRLSSIQTNANSPHIGSTSISMPSIIPSAPQESTNATHQQDDVDVMKIDAANLQDVMQYTGFDLRTEAESMQANIYQQPQSRLKVEEDYRSLPQYFFNAARMRSILSFYCRQFNVKEVDERIMELLGLGLQTRIRNVMQLLVTISRHRVDYGRRLYKIKIENDPKKQFWLLERLRTDPPWKLNASGEEGISPVAAPSEQLEHPLISSSKEQAAKKKQAGAQQSSKPKDDQSSIKSKMTNTTAMNAAGMKQRSWMTSANNLTSLSQEDSSEPSSMENPIEKISLANAPSSIPLTDQELVAQFKSRTINRSDFLSACEHDAKLKRSRLHIQLLDLAPLVNN